MLHTAGRMAIALYRSARLGLIGSKRSWQRVGKDLRMEIDPVDDMDRSFFLGTYDPWLLHAIEHIVRPGDSAIDVGAHKGYVAMHLARQVGPAGTVHAFEPDPRARATLERHRDRNRLGWLRLHACALGGESGEITLALSSRLGWSSLFPNPEAAPTVVERVPVPIRSLDELRRDGTVAFDAGRLSFVKIDAEGAEPLVLSGMRELLEGTHAAMWIEVNRDALAAGGRGPRDIEAPLRDAGLGLWRMVRHRKLGLPRLRLEPIAALDREPQALFDVLAARRAPDGLVAAAPARPE